VLINEPAIAPVGEARPNTQIFRELAQRLGFDEACFRDDDEAIARQAFGATLDFGELREKHWIKLPLPEAPFADGGFPTASGRCTPWPGASIMCRTTNRRARRPNSRGATRSR